MTKGERQAPSQRQLRVGEELRHALAWILERGELHDPALSGVAVTVTAVSVSPDLRNAVAFVVPLGGGDPKAVVAALIHARSFLRRRLAASVKLRYMPTLTFRADLSFDRAAHILQLLNEPRVARDLEGSSVGEGDEAGGPLAP
jgi:ribosome-binding factor A